MIQVKEYVNTTNTSETVKSDFNFSDPFSWVNHVLGDDKDNNLSHPLGQLTTEQEVDLYLAENSAGLLSLLYWQVCG